MMHLCYSSIRKKTGQKLLLNCTLFVELSFLRKKENKMFRFGVHLHLINVPMFTSSEFNFREKK